MVATAVLANDVRIKDWFIHLILSAVYEHDNRKQLYTNQTNLRWKKVNKMRHFTLIADLNVAQKKKSDLSFLSDYFIPVYVSFIIKNCGFVEGFVILAIYFQLKTTIFNVKI